jgi:hypothetical protein
VTAKKVAKPDANAPLQADRQPHRLRLPGFLIEEEVGLGDAIKRVTYAMGIPPCTGCQKRAAALNRWMTLSKWL